MKTTNLKFISMAAIAATALFTACSDDDGPTPPPPTPPTTDGYSSELFLAEDNHNAINQSFSFTNTYVGVVDGGADVASIDNFFSAAAYRGAVQADDDWTAGWTLLNGDGGDNKADQPAAETLQGDTLSALTLHSANVAASGTLGFSASSSYT